MIRTSPRRLAALSACLAALFALAGPVATAQAKGKKYALLIGINEYDVRDLAALKYAESDVEGLARVLKGKGAGFAEVKLLTTSRGRKDKDLAPTAANIRAALAALAKGKGKGDIILVAFAGHGAGSHCFPADCMINQPKTILSYAEINAAVGKSKAGAKLVLIDAARKELGGLPEEEKAKPAEGVAALYSCRPGESSWETQKIAGGVFYHYIIEGLSGKAANKKGEVTWDGLVEYANDKVPEAAAALIGDGAKQTPQSVKNVTGKSPVLATK